MKKVVTALTTLIFLNLYLAQVSAQINCNNLDYTATTPKEAINCILSEKVDESKLKTLTGTIAGVFIIDDFDNPENVKVEYTIQIDNKIKQFFLGDENKDPLLKFGDKVTGNGIDLVNSFVMDKATIIIDQNPSVQFSPPPEDNFGEQKTLVIVANIDNRLAPTTPQQARNLVFEAGFETVNDYYDKNSYNQIFLTGDVLGTYTLNSVCTTLQIQDSALAAAEADVIALGKTFQDYDRLILAVPSTACTSGVGQGSLGKTTVRLPNGELHAMSVSWDYIFDLRVVTHEFGHNFGAAHAGSYNCYNSNNEIVENGFSFTCSRNEFGDVASTMGDSLLVGHHNSPHNKEIGWLSTNSITTATEGNFQLAPLESSQSNVLQMIRIPIEIETNFYTGFSDVYYVIEFRQPVLYDSNFPNSLTDGVSIRVAQLRYDLPDFLSTSYTHVFIDDQPFDAVIKTGESFVDNINGYKITLNGITSSGINARADVAIERIPQIQINFNSPLVHYNFNAITPNLISQSGHSAGGFLSGINKPLLTGEAIEFNGIGSFRDDSGYVLMSGFANHYVKENNAFTVSMKLNADELPQDKATIFKGFGRTFIEIIDGKIEASSVPRSRSAVSLSPNGNIELNRWYHLALTFDSVNGLVLYIDGVEVDRELFNELSFNPELNRLYGVYLGSTPSGRGFNGKVDEFRIYARSLSASEVLDLYQNQESNTFIRGDSNNDNRVDLTDAIFIFNALFRGGPAAACEDAADANDDGRIDISDPIMILGVLFRGFEMPAPFPNPGIDPTEDNFGCGV